MPLSDDQEQVIRTWIGDDLDNSYLEGLYDGMAPDSSWDQVVIMALRRKIALASEQPQSFSVPGLSLSWGQQVDALNKTLSDFLQSAGTGLDEVSTMGAFVGHLVRVRPR
jgi:hypothetical protein